MASPPSTYAPSWTATRRRSDGGRRGTGGALPIAPRALVVPTQRPTGRDTAVFLKATANKDVRLEEEDGKVDMCTSMENFLLLEKVTAVIETYREFGVPDEEIVAKLSTRYGVTPEYVRAIMDGNPPEV